jgi:hypothetical protein
MVTSCNIITENLILLSDDVDVSNSELPLIGSEILETPGRRRASDRPSSLGPSIFTDRTGFPSKNKGGRYFC